MRYLKKYNEMRTEEQHVSHNSDINDFCEVQNGWNYKINVDGTVDVDGDVNLSGEDLTELPVKFNKVTGCFNCALNNLTSFKGFPKYVGDFLSVQNNKITSLEYLPEHTGRLITLEGNLLKDVSSIKHLFADPNKIVWIDDNPIDELLQQMVLLGCSQYKSYFNELRHDVQFDVIDRLDEFDVIKKDKIDMISMNSMFDYYGVKFNETNVTNIVKKCGYEIY